MTAVWLCVSPTLIRTSFRAALNPSNLHSSLGGAEQLPNLLSPQKPECPPNPLAPTNLIPGTDLGEPA